MKKKKKQAVHGYGTSSIMKLQKSTIVHKTYQTREGMTTHSSHPLI